MAGVRDTYPEPWADLAVPLRELRRAATLAVRLAALGRAVSWFRLFPGTPADDCHEASAYWIGELFAGAGLSKPWEPPGESREGASRHGGGTYA
ncbi:hypothetical protein [Streptomyces sp. NPDC053367]|uniref:hypothetical protein n=1 Tax=Streptomyces sp. NPDC053367 TaxID=3365700 RepID=UPI0037D35959